jgi:hypothetical protein
MLFQAKIAGCSRVVELVTVSEAFVLGPLTDTFAYEALFVAFSSAASSAAIVATSPKKIAPGC